MQLPPLDIELQLRQDSQHSTQSMLSPRFLTSSASRGSGSNCLPELDVGSLLAGSSYHVPTHDIFQNISAKKLGTANKIIFDDELNLFQDDGDFLFDDDGNLIEIPVSERASRRVAKDGSDPTPSDQLRKDLQEARTQHERALSEDELNLNFNANEEAALPEAEPFQRPQNVGLEEEHAPLSAEQELSLQSTTQAPARRKRKENVHRRLVFDTELMIKSTELIRLSNEYVSDMRTAKKPRTQHRAAAQAKKNAYWMVLGAGLGGIGNSFTPTSTYLSPLAEHFSGAALLSRITGEPIQDYGRKRAYESAQDQLVSDVEGDTMQTPKRARLDAVRDEEIGLGQYIDEDAGVLSRDMQDELQFPADSSIEVGRVAPATGLPEYPSSSLMPWNRSASAHSQGRSGAYRVPSPSPLAVRERKRQNAAMMDDLVMYGRSDDAPVTDDGDFLMSGALESPDLSVPVMQLGNDHNIDKSPVVSARTHDEDSQWRFGDSQDGEEDNFFAFLRQAITEQPAASATPSRSPSLSTSPEPFSSPSPLPPFPPSHDSPGYQRLIELGVAGARRTVRSALAHGKASISFETLFPIEDTSTNVAAHAFALVLGLATKRRVWVHQQTEKDEGLLMGGDIRIGITGVTERVKI